MIFKRKLIFETCANCGKKIDDDEEALLIDDDNDQIFCSETCLRENFDDQISALEKDHLKWRQPDDIPVAEFSQYEHLLELVLNEPDEIWDTDRTTDDEPPICFYIGEFLHDKNPVYYIAAAYLIEEKPAFVYMHFPTRDQELVQRYRQGTLLYSGADDDETLTLASTPEAAIEGSEAAHADAEEDRVMTEAEEDAFIEPVAKLIEEVSRLRHEDDIQPEDFEDYEILKIKTLEVPDEIWRLVNEEGDTILVHIAYHHFESEFVAYAVLSVEGDLGETFPVYGFPTLDHRLADCLRRGQNIFRRQIQTI